MKSLIVAIVILAAAIFYHFHEEECNEIITSIFSKEETDITEDILKDTDLTDEKPKKAEQTHVEYKNSDPVNIKGGSFIRMENDLVYYKALCSKCGIENKTVNQVRKPLSGYPKRERFRCPECNHSQFIYIEYTK
ncbi:MAG: hypothetical protein KAI43_05810 [Candidatus Aureabacteria bacterium]|nr:hypothetical protein [Candidatus Auribacterota bacterium]